MQLFLIFVTHGGCLQTKLVAVILHYYTVYRDIIYWSKIFTILCLPIPACGLNIDYFYSNHLILSLNFSLLVD